MHQCYAGRGSREGQNVKNLSFLYRQGNFSQCR